MRWILKPSPLIINLMNNLRRLALACLVILSACVKQLPLTVIILDNGQMRTLVTNEQLPKSMLVQAGIILGPADRIFLNGHEIQPDQPLPASRSYTLQIHRVVTLTINGRTIQTPALTVGEALSDAGYSLYVGDRLDPPADTPVTSGIKITYLPSQEFIVTMDNRQVHVRSADQTVEKVLASGGAPILDLDISQPAGNDSIPQDGLIRIVRVAEAIVLAQKSIPYDSQTIDSPDIALGQQVILKPGQTGLSVSRTRIRYEDGQVVKRIQEVESVVRPPQPRVIAAGTKLVINTTTINGVTFQFWRSMKMYATSYSPCRSGVPGQCFNGTKSGLPLQKGVIAVDPSTYGYLVGQKVFIPGYGNAVVGDVGGGYIIEKELGVPRALWIDLGYADSNYQEAPGWITVYFLVPAPATIPAFMK